MFIGKQVILTNNCYVEKRQKKLSKLNGLRSKHSKNALLECLNVNSLQNKFKLLNELIKDTFDIFLMSESRLDPSFSDSQFLIPGYHKEKIDTKMEGEYFSTLLKTYILKSLKVNNYQEI